MAGKLHSQNYVPRLLPLIGLLLASPSAQAHDKVELFGGRSYMRVRNSPSATLNGWKIAGQYEFNEIGLAEFPPELAFGSRRDSWFDGFYRL